MDHNKDILGLLRATIYEETLYLRHWPGKVVDDQDPSTRGRVKVTVPELGFLSDSQAIWASPRQGYSMMPPAPGEWVEVYFVGGDPRRPVYLAGVGEIAGNVPEVYTGPKGRVLWQDASTGDYATYDQDKELLELLVGGVDVKADGKNKKVTIACGGQTVVMDDSAGKTTINGNLEVYS